MTEFPDYLSSTALQVSMAITGAASGLKIPFRFGYGFQLVIFVG